MQHLNTLSQIVSAASTVADLARSSQTYNFHVGSGVTCYVHIGDAEVTIARHVEQQVEIQSKLQAPFGWRVAAEQDEVGVYFVALRRAIVGSVASASFVVTVPQDAHLVLKLERARLSLDNVTGEIALPPQIANMVIVPRFP